MLQELASAWYDRTHTKVTFEMGDQVLTWDRQLRTNYHNKVIRALIDPRVDIGKLGCM